MYEILPREDEPRLKSLPGDFREACHRVFCRLLPDWRDSGAHLSGPLWLLLRELVAAPLRGGWRLGTAPRDIGMGLPRFRLSGAWQQLKSHLVVPPPLLGFSGVLHPPRFVTGVDSNASARRQMGDSFRRGLFLSPSCFSGR